jgi:hypothetical protein
LSTAAVSETAENASARNASIVIIAGLQKGRTVAPTLRFQEQ